MKKVTKIYQKSQNLVTLSLWNERICCKCDRIWAICESYLFHIFFPKKTFYLFGHYFLNRLWDNVLLAMVLTITTLYLPTYLPTYISTYPRVVIYERKLLLRLATDVFAYRTSHRWWCTELKRVDCCARVLREVNRAVTLIRVKNKSY